MAVAEAATMLHRDEGLRLALAIACPACGTMCEVARLLESGGCLFAAIYDCPRCGLSHATDWGRRVVEQLIPIHRPG
ncbi:MAG: hypothetical protein AB1816_00170 [Bacillota bacterium]